MAKCDIKISLDKADLTYETHDSVKCRFKVTVDKPVRCKGFAASILWRTHGKGNRDEKEMQETTLFEGDWEVGTYDYEHSFVIVGEPITYHGKLVNVDWYIKATVDIPWAFDPVEEVDFIVRRRGKSRASPHAENAPEFVGDKNVTDASSELSEKHQTTFLWIAGAISLVAVYLLVTGVYPNLNFMKILFAIVALYIAYGIGWRHLKDVIAAKKFGSIAFEVDKHSVSPGENCQARFRFTPNEDISINGLSLQLVGLETATAGSGTNEVTYHETIFAQRLDLNVPEIARAGIAVERTAEIQIPDTAPATFLAADNSVTWTLKAVLDIEKWVDFERTQPIHVS